MPEPEEEQLRDLVRAREDVRVDLMRARHRLSKLLLRRELYHPGSGNAWTAQHREWLDSLRFDDGASQVVFTDYLEAQDLLRTRRDRLERELEALGERVTLGQDDRQPARPSRHRHAPATGLCAAIGEFGRFDPEQLASYLGLVPSEENNRRAAPAGIDHQGGLQARPAAAA